MKDYLARLLVFILALWTVAALFVMRGALSDKISNLQSSVNALSAEVRR